jgi:pectate lyase
MLWEYPASADVRPLTYVGGNWQRAGSGLQQSDTSGSAFAIAPNPEAGDQIIEASARLDSWGSTNPVSSFGLVARYVDSQNYYYLSVRSSNSLQIRKVVNGVVTVLKTVTLTIQPGGNHDYGLEVRGNELSAIVDGIVLARALDDSLTSGQYGLATYRAGATFSRISAVQP